MTQTQKLKQTISELEDEVFHQKYRGERKVLMEKWNEAISQFTEVLKSKIEGD